MIDISFIGAKAQALQQLSGWKKSYRLPDNLDGATQLFVARLAAEELKNDLDLMYAAIKGAFGFIRRDLDVSAPEDGTGAIITPYFTYSVTLSHNPNDREQGIWTRMVDAIHATGPIASPAFARVFDGMFSTVQSSLPTDVDIEEFIDAVEAAKIPGLNIFYDREATYCQLQLKELGGRVTLTSRTLSIVHDLPKKTGDLLESFETLRKFAAKHNVPGIPSPGL